MLTIIKIIYNFKALDCSSKYIFNCSPFFVIRVSSRAFADLKNLIEIIIVKSENEYKIINFLDLLPYSFGPEDL